MGGGRRSPLTCHFAYCACCCRPYTQTGEQALERVSFQKSTVRGAALAQTGILAGCYLGAYGVLQRNRPKFLSVTPIPSVGCSSRN